MHRYPLELALCGQIECVERKLVLLCEVLDGSAGGSRDLSCGAVDDWNPQSGCGIGTSALVPNASYGPHLEGSSLRYWPRRARVGAIVTGLGRATRFGAPPGAVSAVAHNLCPPGMEHLADEVVDHTQHRFVPSLNPCAGPIRGRIVLAL